MPGAELRYDSSDRRGTALNSLLGVGAASMLAAAEVMLAPGLVLAFFVAELTPSYVTIGLVPAIALSFWTLARVPAILITGSRRRQQPWAFAAALVAAGAFGILGIVSSATDPNNLGQSARPLMAAFFLCLVVYSLATGFGGVPTAVLQRASISGEVWGGFIRRRALASGTLAIVAALIVARLLGSGAMSFPTDYGRLFLAATVCLIAAAAFLAAMREPVGVPASPALPTLTLRTMRQPFVDSRFRRFLVFRVLLSSTAAIDPFLFLYAVTRLGVPVNAIGGYLLAGVLGWVMTAPGWRWIERRSGVHATLQAASVVRLVAPAAALALPPLAATEMMREQFPQDSPLTWAFGVGFFAIGAALAAQSRGTNDYLSALAPRAQFATYTAATNAILAIVAFSPVIGGIMIQRAGYETLFVAALAVGLASVFAAGALVRMPAAVSNGRANHQQSAGLRALPMGRT